MECEITKINHQTEIEKINYLGHPNFELWRDPLDVSFKKNTQNYFLTQIAYIFKKTETQYGKSHCRERERERGVFFFS